MHIKGLQSPQLFWVEEGYCRFEHTLCISKVFRLHNYFEMHLKKIVKQKIVQTNILVKDLVVYLLVFNPHQGKKIYIYFPLKI